MLPSYPVTAHNFAQLFEFPRIFRRNCPKRVGGAYSVALKTTQRPFSCSVYRPNPHSERCLSPFSDSFTRQFSRRPLVGNSVNRGRVPPRQIDEQVLKFAAFPATSPPVNSPTPSRSSRQGR